MNPSFNERNTTPMTRSYLTPLGLSILILISAPSLPAAGSRSVFELVGKIVPTEPDLLRSKFPTVSLQGVGTSYSTRTLADSKGSFKFKRLPTGMYTLTVFIPPVRPQRRTIDIGPSFADSKGRILLSIPFKPQPPSRRNYTVSATQLAIPESARAEFQKAQEFLEKRDTERGIASLKKAVEFAPQFAGAWNTLGVIAYQSEQLEEAEMYFRRALNLNPSYYGALVNLGALLVSREKVEESVEIFLRAIELRPDDPMGQARLGMTYLHLGNLDKAEERFMETKKIEPGHFSLPHLFLAQIFGRRGARAAAIRELEEFLKIHPDSERASDVRKTIDMLRSP